MVIFTNHSLLAAAITARCSTSAVIGIDGWTGAGKTTLAGRLAEITNGTMFDVDDALIKDQSTYVSAIQKYVIEQAIQNSHGIVFLAGICLREIMQNVDRQTDINIYLMRMASWGWADEDEISGNGLPELIGASGVAVRQEMRRYHEKWKPHLTADFVFHRFS